MVSATASAYSDNNDEVTPRTETTGVSAPAGPARAMISRERTVRTTQGKYGKRGKSDVKKVSLHERLAEFPNGNLVIRGGNLFCNACKERVLTKKSILKSHFTSLLRCFYKFKVKSRSIISAFFAKMSIIYKN